MPALVCPDCSQPWPTDKAYTTCPECLVDTRYSTGASAMLVKDAEHRVKEIKFDRYYRVWDEKREKRGDPIPEQIGALEAREIARLEKAWRDG